MGESEIRVVQLINAVKVGGAENLVLELAAGFPEEVQCTVLCFDGDRDYIEHYRESGVDIVDLGAGVGLPRFDPVELSRAYRYLREIDYDVLHAHLPYSQTVGRVLGATTGAEAVVSTQHNVRGNYHLIERTLERLTRRLDDSTVAVSDGVKESFPCQNRDWRTIYNGIDVQQFNREIDAIESDTAIDGEAVTYLNLASCEPEKRQRDLVEAMGHVVETEPNAHLYIVGGGSLLSSIRAQVREHDLESSVTVTGRVPSVHKYYASADVFVSSSRFEGMPITFLEAMAAELPIVATEIPGVTEVVDDGHTGYLVSPESPSQLAEAMVDLTDESRRLEFGKRAYQRVETKFDISSTIDQYISCYTE